MTHAELVRALLGRPLDTTPIESLEAWWSRHLAATKDVPDTLARATLGGLSADRIGYAFASGYHSALGVLDPSTLDGKLAALCVTERGGGHPRAIETTLRTAEDGSVVVRGEKRWATLSTHADVLLVVGSMGEEAGKKKLRVVRVPRGAPGATLRPMPETAFAPEIPHAEISLDDVRVDASAVLPGDGYELYVKPFRTIEDMHVFAALAGHVVHLVRRLDLDRRLAEQAVALVTILHSLGARPPFSPETHVALAGVVPLFTGLVGAVTRALSAEGEPRARWERDLPLFAVASTAREKRAEVAWSALASERQVLQR